MTITPLVDAGDGQVAELANGDTAEKKNNPEKGSKRNDPYKIQIQMNNRQRNALFHLQEATGVESSAQVVRDALRVYEHLVTANKKGQNVLLEDSTTGKQTYIEFL